MKIFNLQVNFTMKKIYPVFMLLIGSSSIRAQHIDVSSHVHDEKVIKSSTTGIHAWAIFGEAEGYNGQAVVGIATGAGG